MSGGRRMTGKLCGIAVAVLALAGTPPAAADQTWKSSSAVWRQMDACTIAARKAFPDYTHEGNTKRDAFRQNCLRQSNLPSESDASRPLPAPQASDATPSR